MYQVYEIDTGFVVALRDNPSVANAMADQLEEASAYDTGHTYGVCLAK
jgi:hypothetical protein